MSMSKTIAIIPGKSQSVRIPNKNIVDLGGKPLIEWTIEASQGLFDEVVVATNSSKVKSIAKKYDVKVVDHPQGDPGATAVAIDVLETKVNKHLFDNVFLLQATSPFRTNKTLRTALYHFRYTQDDHPLTMFGIAEVGKRCTYHDIGTTYKKRNFLVPQFTDSPQNTTNSYRVNGAIFATTVNNLINKKAFVKDIWSLPFLMNNVESIEIDTEEDLALARLVAKGMASS